MNRKLANILAKQGFKRWTGSNVKTSIYAHPITNEAITIWVQTNNWEAYDKSNSVIACGSTLQTLVDYLTIDRLELIS